MRPRVPSARVCAPWLLGLSSLSFLALAAGLLVWEWPRELSPRFVSLELQANDQLPGSGLLLAAAGVREWNGSTLRVPARVLYLVPDEQAVAIRDTFATLVAVHLPEGPSTSDRELLVDHLASATYTVDDEGFLEWLYVEGTDEISGRVFSIRTTGSRASATSRFLELELETSTPKELVP